MYNYDRCCILLHFEIINIVILTPRSILTVMIPYFTGEGLAVNWRWTWLNFVTSILVNRVLFLLDIGKYHLHAWIVNETEVSESYQLFWHIEFYLNTLLIGMHLALFQFSAFDFGVLLPETPEEAHVFQDGQVQPLLEVPMPTLTR